MKIMKFGGSSVGDVGRINEVIDIIAGTVERGDECGVVFSALGGVTDQLIEISQAAANEDERYEDKLFEFEKQHFKIINELIGVKGRNNVLVQIKMMANELSDVLHGVFLVKELTVKTLDFILSFGERLAGIIISEALKENGIAAEYLDARALVRTDDHFGSARIDAQQTYQNIIEYFDKHKGVQIITGFIGSTEKNETTTLGRGGSDLTASIFAAALDAEELEIWTDVTGVMSADPRKVKDAFAVAEMTYEEAMEMSHFGARVIYPPTIQPVLEKNIPIRIKNTFAPEEAGSIISDKVSSGGDYLIKGISSTDKVALLRVQGSGMIGITGIAGRLFAALATERINIILISQASSEHSICFAVEDGIAGRAKRLIEKEFALEMNAKMIDEVIVENDLIIVAIVGENMKHKPGISGKLFQALGDAGVNVIAIAQGSSELNISAMIRHDDEIDALNAIHKTFFP